MRNNSSTIVVIIYMSIILIYCIVPILELIDFESLDLPWDHARITDVDYTAKVLDEQGKRWSCTCYRKTNIRCLCCIKK